MEIVLLSVPGGLAHERLFVAEHSHGAGVLAAGSRARLPRNRSTSADASSGGFCAVRAQEPA